MGFLGESKGERTPRDFKINKMNPTSTMKTFAMKPHCYRQSKEAKCFLYCILRVSILSAAAASS